MAVLDSLPNTPLKYQTLMNLSDQIDDTITILPVVGCETDGLMLSDIILAFYINTGNKRVIVGFDGTGWQPIEETSPSSTFTTDEDDVFTWFDDRETYDWLAANGIDLDAPLTTYATNKSEAPHFLQHSVDDTA